MRMPVAAFLRDVFINPHCVEDYHLQQWDLLIRQARSANVLVRLAEMFKESALFDAIPDKPRMHLESAWIHAQRFKLSLIWEIKCIEKALLPIDEPIIFLKGAAYHLADNHAGKGRLFSDIDILVPEKAIPEVERALIKGGWMTNTFDPYDQRYYREWMHEIPPMRHLKRQTTLDVHHNILPKTCKFCPDSKKLLANIVQTGENNTWVLAPEDRILHSATHLFHEGELEQGFRDLSDLDLLLKEFATHPDFWSTLLLRADELKQRIPLYYALRYTHAILDTPVPQSVLDQSEKYLTGRVRRAFMDFLFLRALMPNHASCNDRWTGFARWLIYIRSHALKMPIRLLIPHLLRKSFRRFSSKDTH
ncbi:nucleotidyltransferase family protein [Methylicorpusculum sp.]|uniref:nucleotidyltransferase domain-containing protein n=1 Tax=Methylicorpusculum sp. TaxID=2713644 RepID=UPI002725C85A|nr:nucleotidyltransferase family protein [Methylicorpusculum sp.]MDO8843394.1 nucleotidyltransferase family protein [Methylicorpusculum sp.]